MHAANENIHSMIRQSWPVPMGNPQTRGELARSRLRFVSAHRNRRYLWTAPVALSPPVQDLYYPSPYTAAVFLWLSRASGDPPRSYKAQRGGGLCSESQSSWTLMYITVRSICVARITAETRRRGHQSSDRGGRSSFDPN